MKQLLLLILTALLLLNCKQKESEQTKTEVETSSITVNNKIDTIVVYWETNFDTSRQHHEINIENDVYELELKTYSLNDSSIVKMNIGGKSEIHKDIYHDHLTDLILKKENNVILKSQINKTTFKDSLSGDFLKYSVLTNVKYESIRSNRLYFKADLDVPDTDWSTELDFAIFYRTNKKGQIEYWNVEESD